MTLSLMTLRIMAFDTEYCYAECHLCCVSQVRPLMVVVIMLNVIMLSVVMLNVVAAHFKVNLTPLM
jgi:hypothetical protein